MGDAGHWGSSVSMSQSEKWKGEPAEPLLWAWGAGQGRGHSPEPAPWLCHAGNQSHEEY